VGLSNASTHDPSLRMTKHDLPAGLPTLGILLCQAGNPRFGACVCLASSPDALGFRVLWRRRACCVCDHRGDCPWQRGQALCSASQQTRPHLLCARVLCVFVCCRYTCKVLVPGPPPGSSGSGSTGSGPASHALDLRSQKVKFVRGLTADRVRVTTAVHLPSLRLDLVRGAVLHGCCAHIYLGRGIVGGSGCMHVSCAVVGSGYMHVSCTVGCRGLPLVLPLFERNCAGPHH
jgi:hypothetical protein